MKASMPVSSPFLPRNATTTLLLAGAAAEVAIISWSLSFVFRMRACSSECGDRLRTFIMVSQAGLLSLIAAFVWTLMAKQVKAASWIAAAYFGLGLVTASLTRLWLHRIRPCCHAKTSQPHQTEFMLVDIVNWSALFGVAVKIVGLMSALWVALR